MVNPDWFVVYSWTSSIHDSKVKIKVSLSLTFLLFFFKLSFTIRLYFDRTYYCYNVFSPLCFTRKIDVSTEGGSTNKFQIRAMTLLVPLKNTPFRGLNLQVPPKLTWAGFDSNKVHILIGFTMKDPSAVSIGYLSRQCINIGLKTGYNCRS